jgi:hypothetical protein
MDSIPNFTPTDIEMVQQLVHHRYQERVEIQVTDSELMLTSEREQLVDYPKLFWHVHGANFAVIRSGLNRYRRQFFYTPHDQHFTGQEEYDSLELCVITPLQIQGNHERGHALSSFKR